MARAYSGVFRAGNDAHALWVAEWPSFETKWKELSGQGLRLSSISASVEGGRTQFAGVYRAGSGGHALWVAPWASFEAKWKELSGKGLRLTSMATYVEGGSPRFAGVFRAGSDGHALWVAPWASFEAKWKELSGKGLRLDEPGDLPRRRGAQVRRRVPRRLGRSRPVGGAVGVVRGEVEGAQRTGPAPRLARQLPPPGTALSTPACSAPAADGHALWVGVDWENFVVPLA